MNPEKHICQSSQYPSVAFALCWSTSCRATTTIKSDEFAVRSWQQRMCACGTLQFLQTAKKAESPIHIGLVPCHGEFVRIRVAITKILESRIAFVEALSWDPGRMALTVRDCTETSPCTLERKSMWDVKYQPNQWIPSTGIGENFDPCLEVDVAEVTSINQFVHEQYMHFVWFSDRSWYSRTSYADGQKTAIDTMASIRAIQTFKIRVVYNHSVVFSWYSSIAQLTHGW